MQLFSINRRETPPPENTEFEIQLLQKIFYQAKWIERQTLIIEKQKQEIAEIILSCQQLEDQLQKAELKIANYVSNHQQAVLSIPGTVNLTSTFPSFEQIFNMFHFVMDTVRCDFIDHEIITNSKLSKEILIVSIYKLICHIQSSVSSQFRTIQSNTQGSLDSVLSQKSDTKSNDTVSETDPITVSLRQYMRSHINTETLKYHNLEETLKMIGSPLKVTPQLEHFAQTVLYLSWVCFLSSPRLYWFTDDTQFSDKRSIRAATSNMQSVEIKYHVYPGLMMLEKKGAEHSWIVKLKGEVVT